MANRGERLIRNVQEAAEDNLRELKQMPSEVDFDASAEGRPDADSPSLQELLIMNLADLARNVDAGWSSKSPDSQQLRSLSDQESLSLVAFFDGLGQVISSNRQVPEEILRLALPVIRGGEEIKINIFSRPESGYSARFLALRRSSAKGAILLGAWTRAGFDTEA